MNVFDLRAANLSEIAETARNKQLEYPDELRFLNTCARGQINLACAKTGVGKSWFLTQFAYCMNSKYPVLYISLENGLDVDVERFIMCQNLYSDQGNPLIYANDKIWSGKDWLENKAVWQEFPLVCIDGLETVLPCSADKSFEEYQKAVVEIRNKFPNSAIWISWQLNRTYDDIPDKTGKITAPRVDDIAYSYAAARLASNIIGIYRAAKEDKYNTIVNLKGRCGNTENYGQLAWGKAFQPFIKDEQLRIQAAQLSGLQEELSKLRGNES